MVGPKQVRWTAVGLATGVAIALVLGIQLRLSDPMGTKALPAEDPYNHMALVREHARDGSFDPLNPDGALYPPGMHALIGAIWFYTGADLYDVMRVGPVLFGALGILGIAFLLWRIEGPVAAFVGALAFAVAPEIISRTTMMSPTALDLALLPFLLYTLLQTMQGRLGWAGPSAALLLLLVFAHPWIVTIIALAGAAFFVLSALIPWTSAWSMRFTTAGLATAVALVGLSWGLSLTGCWGYCGTGFEGKFAGGGRLNGMAPFIIGGSVLLSGLLAWGPRVAEHMLAPPTREPTRTTKTLESIFIGVLLVVATVPALVNGMPPEVHLVGMFGYTLLAFAAVGLVAMPFIRTPASFLGGGIVATTYPFVIYNPFDSPFWSHRTAVFMGVGIVLFAGVIAQAATRYLTKAITTARPQGVPIAARASRMFVALPIVLVGLTFGGSVYAATPQGDTIPWYRLYDDCAYAAFEEFAATASADPQGVIVTGDWRPKLVLAALTTDASRVWYKDDFYQGGDTQALLREMKLQQRALYAVVDGHVWTEHPNADTSFVYRSPWTKVDAWCPDPETGRPQVEVFMVRP